MKQGEYAVASGVTTQDLVREVNALLADGWELVGGIAVDPLSENETYGARPIFYQALER